MVRIDVLGSFRAEIVLGGVVTDITPTSARERAALAALALAAPGALTVDALATELYDEDGVADPRNAVQATISRIRKALGTESHRLVTTPAGYCLVEPEVDVDHMEHLRRHGDVTGALAIWRSPSLSDLDLGEMLEAERVRLEEIRSSLVEHLLHERLDDDPAGSIADLEAAVAEQPLREHRWELLMLALYRSGRQADALRAFQRARTHLNAQLGIDPGPTLIELEQRILHQDPSLSSPGSRPDPAARHLLPSGTVSVLLCDVEGSVRQWEARPTDTAQLIEEMHELWASAITGAGGAVVKSTGDGVLALFETAGEALQAAAEGQRAQLRSDLRVRVAVHTGEVVSIDGDVRGPTVNRTARLLELAHGDQILVSGVTAELAGASISASALTLRSLGTHWLRDVSEPVEIHQLSGDALPSTFAGLRSSGPSQLPRLRNSLLGRDDQRSELVELVGSEPLVTLLGTGGIGKTSLALAVGWTIADNRSVTFVDLASVRDQGQVAGRIAETLVGADPTSSRTPIERITDRLGANPDLLVIDNAEHLLDAVADTVDEILRAELKGSVLVTSRQPLAVAGERLFTLPPLSLPDADADLAHTGRNPSVQLFVERMRAASPSAELPDGLLPVVAHICRRLDGIPLAIELAAGRTGLLAIEDIAARLDDQLRLLRQVPATREARHASLEAVARWSLEQLAAPSRALFAYLSVMTGAFDVRGAEALASRAGLDPLDALDGVSELVAASLLAKEPGGARFRMLEPIRQLALSELQRGQAETPARRAHAEWMTDRVSAAHITRDESRSQLFRTLDADADQLISAIRWASDQLVDGPTIDHAGDALDADQRALRAAELAMASAFWFLEQDPGTGAVLLNELRLRIDREQHPVAWARATIGWTISTATMPVEGSGPDALAAVAILDEHDDPDRGTARLGAIFAQFGTSDNESRRLLAETELLIPSDEQWTRAILDLVAMMLEAIGSLAQPPTGSVEEAISRGERSAASLRRLGDRWALGAALGELGRIHRIQGDYEQAAACYHESIDLFGDQHYHGLHYILTELGHMASLRGEHESARHLHARALQMAVDDGSASCRAQALVGSARSELLAGNRSLARERVVEARDLHPSWEILSYGMNSLDDELVALVETLDD